MHISHASTLRGDVLRRSLMFFALLALAASLSAAGTPDDDTQPPPPPLNRCVGCHLSATNLPARLHVAEWSQSAHARQGITCDRCHGGDPSAASLAQAHRGVVSSRYPTSRVSRRHLPETCGDCHGPQLDAFRKSAHYALLEQNVRLGPSCSDCHGATATALPDSAALEKRCARCHGTASAGEDRPRLARQALLEVVAVRAMLQRTARHVEREPDLARHERLMREQIDARALATAVVDALHSFNLRDVAERLVRAREAAEALVEQFERDRPAPSSPPAAERDESIQR